MLSCLIVILCYALLSSHGARFAQSLALPLVYYRLGTCLLLASFAFVLREPSDAWSRVDRWLLGAPGLKRLGKLARSRAFPLLLVSLGLVLVVAALAWRWQSIRGWQALPPWQADMFPTIQRGIAAFLAGKNPYEQGYWFSAPDPRIAPWQTYMVYLPGIWLPFAVAKVIGLGEAFVSVSSTVAVLGIFILAAIDAWNRCWNGEEEHQESRGGPQAVLFSCYALLLGGLFFLKHFSAVLHTSPLWLYLALFCYLAVSGRTNAASALLGVCCASRPSAVVLLPAWFIFLLRDETGRLRRRLPFLAVPFVLLVGPFLLWNPRAFLFSTVSWYQISSSRAWRLRPDWVTNSFGLTGILFRAGLGNWLLAAQIACQLLVVLLAWKGLRTIRDCMQYMSWALLLFYMTVPVPYGYIYSECLLLLSFALLAGLAGTLSLPLAPGAP
jgi:F0F1-type ATP synthase assembly protein I